MRLSISIINIDMIGAEANKIGYTVLYPRQYAPNYGKREFNADSITGVNKTKHRDSLYLLLYVFTLFK